MACENLQVAVEKKLGDLVTALSQESEELSNDIRDRAAQINPDIDTSGVDVWVDADFDITWKRTSFKLDLPEVTMKDRQWSLDVPQVTVNNKDIIFHTPSVRMKTVQIGTYPETVVRWVVKKIGPVKTKVPEVVVIQSPMYADMPESFMQEQRIVVGVPEFTMGRVDFSVKVPEFAMRTREFSLNLPQVTVKRISVEAAKAEEQGRALNEEATLKSELLSQQLKENAKQEIGSDVSSLFDCYHTEMVTKRNEAAAQFEQGIALLQSSINSMISNKVPPDNETVVALQTQLVELSTQRDQFFQLMETKMIELNEQQKGFFDNLGA